LADRSRLRIEPYTVQPLAASLTALARPIPELAPVMRATVMAGG
jgi:hypothetical protein